MKIPAVGELLKGNFTLAKQTSKDGGMKMGNNDLYDGKVIKDKDGEYMVKKSGDGYKITKIWNDPEGSKLEKMSKDEIYDGPTNKDEQVDYSSYYSVDERPYANDGEYPDY